MMISTGPQTYRQDNNRIKKCGDKDIQKYVDLRSNG